MRRNRRDGQGATPRRGLAARRGRAPEVNDTRSDAERIAAVAHEAHVPVEDVLREVADFRLALETDMIIAAAAADAESEDLLAEVVDGERAELATFHDRLLERLADAAASDELALRRARREPRRTGGRTARWIASAAAAATIVATGSAALRPGSGTRVDANSVALATASQQYADLSHAVNNESAAEVRDAAAELHETLEQLISEHAGDPVVAHRAAELLQAEISLLQVRDPAGASHVIAQARSLVKMLRTSTPPQLRASVAPILDAVATPTQKPRKPSASAKTSTSPSPKATTASPSASPSASGTKSDPGADEPNPLDSP